MKSFDTLIRLAKSDVDECQRSLSQIQDKMDALDLELVQLDHLREEEKQKASLNPESAPAFGMFLTLYRQKKDEIGERKLAMEPALEEARDRLAEAFEKQKRYEITKDLRVAEEKAKLKAKEQALQDELGMVLHRRRAKMDE